jgi:acyl-CoA synthetase (NDP forming)
MRSTINYPRKHFLDPFFYPKSVAIVGATRNPIKMNFQITENLRRLNFQGKIYPVNPNANEILGIKTYHSLKDIPDDIDLVVSAVPAHITKDVVKDCVEKGWKRMVIVAGVFSEGGEKGEEMQEEIVKLINENGIRVLGPNTLSPINTSNNLVISFHRVEELREGGLAFVFQSGLYEYKLNWFFSHLGISKIIDLGNKMDINEVDALEYLAEDPDTKVIAMHIESIRGDGRRFMQLLKSTSKEKPIIILKSGRTRAGSKAAASHTGSIARENDALFDSMLIQAGIIRAQGLEGFFDFAKTFEFLNPPNGNRTAVVNLSGGEGVIATDACEQNGLRMAELSGKTFEKLREIFPPWKIPLNPFDAGVCMEFHITDFNKVFSALTSMPEDENVDCVIMQIPSSAFLKAEAASSLITNIFGNLFLRMRGRGKPLVLWRSSMDSMEDEFVKRLELKQIPVYPSSERAVKALAALYKYKVM